MPSSSRLLVLYFIALILLLFRFRDKAMSTLEYLDDQGSVRNFGWVPWKTLHSWLSSLNGHPNAGSSISEGVNRGKVLEELESRRKKRAVGSSVGTEKIGESMKTLKGSPT